MIITIDGNAGAGKTRTQRFIGDTFNLPIYEKRCINDKILEELRDIPKLLWLLSDRHSWNWEHANKAVIDEYWLPFRQACVPIKSETENIRLLNLSLEILQLNGGKLPDFSFYIEITTLESYYRKEERKAKEEKTFYQRPAELDMTQDNPTRDAEYKEFWRWMRKQIPNFYIINGMQSENKVRSEIVEIIRKTLGV